MTSKPTDPRAVWQARVSKVVWGLFLIAAGVVMTLDSQGVIRLSRPAPFPASHATDGDSSTRWSSRWRDGESITVDLGAPAAIGRVRLHWEAAYASTYDLEVSDDARVWTKVATVRDGDGGVDEHVVAGGGRYVRMVGHERGRIEKNRREKGRYGVSLWEMEVLGADGQVLSHGKTATASSVEATPLWFLYWPIFLVVAGLPAVLAPKDGSDQMVGVMVVVIGTALQLRLLGIIKMRIWEMIPVFLVIGGLLLILEAVRHRNGSRDAGTPEGVR